MRNNFFLLVGFLFFSYILKAQDTIPKFSIKGIIVDDSQIKPIEKATIQFFSNGVEKFLLSDKNGQFLYQTFEVVDSLKITATGFEVKLLQKPINNNFDFKEITLLTKAKELKEVSVIAQKKSITFELNKITYNVQADTGNKGLTGLEVIQNVPLIEVGSNNKIYVNGKSSFIVLLNGRNSGITGTDPAAFLKSLQSALISKIEVNTNPPAKYRLEGYEYVINLVISKKLVDGVFGSLNGSFDTFGGYDLGYLLMLKADKLRITNNTTYSFLKSPSSDYFFSNTNNFSKNSNSQNGTLKNKSNTIVSNLDMNYEIDTLKLLSFSFVTQVSALKSTSSLNNTYLINNIINKKINRDITDKDDNGFIYGSLGYEVLLNKKRNTLNFSTKWFNNHAKSNTDFTDNNTLNSNKFTGENSLKSIGNEYTFQIDYLKYINQKSNLELGTKEVIRIFKSTNFFNNNKVGDNKYSQNIHSVYFAYNYYYQKNSFTIGNSFTQTTINFKDFLQSNSTTKNYFNPLPFVNYARELKNGNSIIFDYTLNIKRPSLTYIMTGKKYTNPDNLQTGNPSLSPELFNELKLTYNTKFIKKPLIVGFYLRNSSNSIVENITPFQDSLILRNYNNDGRFFSVGNTLYFSKKFFKKFTVRITSDVGYVSLINKASNLKNDNINYKLFLTLSYKLPYKFTISSQNFIYSKSITMQGYNENFSDIRLSVGKKLLKDKLNVGLTLYQPLFKKITLTSAYSDLEFSNYSYTRFPSRYLSLSASYDFGNIAKVFGGRQKRKGVTNDDLKEK